MHWDVNIQREKQNKTKYNFCFHKNNLFSSYNQEKIWEAKAILILLPIVQMTFS